MSWLRKLFGSNAAPRKAKIDKKKSEPQGFGLNDTSYHANRDVIEAMQFSATLLVRTPLETLQRHGEIFEGAPSEAPKYGTQADGIWLFYTKGSDINEYNHASDVGQVKPRDYLPFLKDFRKIVESDESLDIQLGKLKKLPSLKKEYSNFWSTLLTNYDDFPESFFYNQFTNIPRVGGKLAKELFYSGYKSFDDIKNASIEDLTKVNGLGKNTANSIKSFFV